MPMQDTDVVIAGGGLAGSLAGAMLGRAGIRTVVIDPHPVYPPDFRCEKLDGPQMQTLGLTGLADAVLKASTADRECWVARFGRVVEKRPGDQQGIMYDTLVNTIRAEVSGKAEFIQSKVTDITAGPERQLVRTVGGAEISARLAVMATGLNVGVREKLGIGREIVSTSHSISIGFDAVPGDARGFPFPALTYFAESPADRMAYITLFPVGAMMRANLFGYRDLHDPWLKAAPQRAARDALRDVAGAASADGRLHGAGIREDPSGRSLCDRRDIASPAWCWSATRSARHARRRAPARAKCWSTSSGSATCTSRAGSKHRGWARRRSRRSTTTR